MKQTTILDWRIVATRTGKGSQLDIIDNLRNKVGAKLQRNLTVNQILNDAFLEIHARERFRERK